MEQTLFGASTEGNARRLCRVKNIDASALQGTLASAVNIPARVVAGSSASTGRNAWLRERLVNVLLAGEEVPIVHFQQIPLQV